MKREKNVEFYWGVTPEKDREMLRKAQLEEKYDDGFADGKKKANIKIAKRLYKKRISLETILEVTDLNMKELFEVYNDIINGNQSDEDDNNDEDFN